MSVRDVIGFECVTCGARHEVSPWLEGTCPACGPDGILDVLYDYDAIRSRRGAGGFAGGPASHWRYQDLLPIGGQAKGADPIPLPHLQVGFSPVYDLPRMARRTGVRRFFLKDDGRNPTGSFKDRASSVGVVRALESGAKAIACASTGNAASSCAGFAAATGLPALIFVPDRAPEPKLTQLLIFGATVIQVRGPYEAAYDLCQRACGPRGWYNRNCAQNPHLVEGKKTCGLEIAEQLAAEMPDWVAVSVGDGCTIAAIGKGLQEMRTLGLTDRVPRLLGVQAEGAAPIVKAFREDKDLEPASAHTLADSIAVGVPRNWRKAIRAVRETDGTYVAVSDEAILEAMRVSAREAGVFAEPAGATSLAGVFHALQAGIIGRGESVCIVVTGNGLKDVATAQKAAGTRPLEIEPTDDDLAKVLGPPE